MSVLRAFEVGKEAYKLMSDYGLDYNIALVIAKFILGNKPLSSINIKLFDKNCKPYKKYDTDAGFDLRARIQEKKVIFPGGSLEIPSGVAIELPAGYEAQVRPRSGIAFKYNVVGLLGTIDSEYRGEIGLKLYNFSDKPFIVKPYMRIAQLVINKIELPELKIVDELSRADRGKNGFGSTGVE